MKNAIPMIYIDFKIKFHIFRLILLELYERASQIEKLRTKKSEFNKRFKQMHRKSTRNHKCLPIRQLGENKNKSFSTKESTVCLRKGERV